MIQHPLSALVVDGSAPVRISLRGLLQGFEMTDIDAAATVAEARRKLSSRKYDVILCEYHFDGEETGQDLLEQIAEERMQPPPTIFIMVTTEANYPRVMSVAEIVPDEYILKPIQTGQLSDRLEKALARRHALLELHEALYAGKYNKALKMAQEMMTYKSPYTSDVAKIVAQTLCKLERFNEAAVFYRHIAKTKSLPWAKFGLAKVSLMQGDRETTEAMLLDVINQHLRYLPVYDCLVDFYLDAHQHAPALDILQRALEISPHSMRRIQRAGQLAFGLGDKAAAAKYLNRALALRGSTVELDFRTMFQLVVLRFDAGESAEGASLVKQMRAKHGDFNNLPNQFGMTRGQASNYCDLATAVEVLATRPLGTIDLMRALAGEWESPDFDLAFAMDYMSVVARLYTPDLAPTLCDWIGPIKGRFSTDEAVRELLTVRLKGCPELLSAFD